MDGEGGGGAAGTEEGLGQRHGRREAFSTVPIKELHAVIMCDHKITFHQILSRERERVRRNIINEDPNIHWRPPIRSMFCGLKKNKEEMINESIINCEM